MFHDLKSLLGDALNRNRIAKEVTTAQVIDAANLAIVNILPQGRLDDARAISLRDGTLTIGCKNAAAGAFISERSKPLQEAIIARVPTANILRIRTSLVSGFDSGI